MRARGLGLIEGLPAEEAFGSLAVGVNGLKTRDESLTIGWDFTDSGRAYPMTLPRGITVSGGTGRRVG